jgi:hypothetical protein
MCVCVFVCVCVCVCVYIHIHTKIGRQTDRYINRYISFVDCVQSTKEIQKKMLLPETLHTHHRIKIEEGEELREGGRYERQLTSEGGGRREGGREGGREGEKEKGDPGRSRRETGDHQHAMHAFIKESKREEREEGERGRERGEGGAGGGEEGCY